MRVATRSSTRPPTFQEGNVASGIQPEDEGLQAAQRVTGLQAVLFDMDGLLVDTEPLWFEVETEVMARLGGDWSPADQAKLVGGSLQATLGYLLGKAAHPVPRETLARWMLDAMTAKVRSAQVTLRPGAAALLAEVKAAGVPYALVTSSERVIMDAVLDVTGLRFPVTVCAEDVTR